MNDTKKFKCTDEIEFTPMGKVKIVGGVISDEAGIIAEFEVDPLGPIQELYDWAKKAGHYHTHEAILRYSKIKGLDIIV